MDKSTDPRDESIGIIGAGAAGLITAQTLLRDGFKNVQLLTRDKSVGGVWAAERVYPGLLINKYCNLYPQMIDESDGCRSQCSRGVSIFFYAYASSIQCRSQWRPSVWR